MSRAVGIQQTACTNPGCSQIINQHHKEQHESQLCRFRFMFCNDCKQQVSRNLSHVHPGFSRKEVDSLVNDMRQVKDDVKQMKQEEFIQDLMLQVSRQSDIIEDLCHKMSDMKEKIEITKEASKRCDLFTERQKIFVCGGGDDKVNLYSVVSFSWPENTWTLEPEVKMKRPCFDFSTSEWK